MSTLKKIGGFAATLLLWGVVASGAVLALYVILDGGVKLTSATVKVMGEEK